LPNHIPKAGGLWSEVVLSQLQLVRRIAVAKPANGGLLAGIFRILRMIFRLLCHAAATTAQLLGGIQNVRHNL